MVLDASLESSLRSIYGNAGLWHGYEQAPLSLYHGWASFEPPVFIFLSIDQMSVQVPEKPGEGMADP